jgi:hypothetical protein
MQTLPRPQVNVQFPPELLAAAKKLAQLSEQAFGQVLSAAWWDGCRTGAVAATLTLVVLFVLFSWRKK